ncbi:AIR carboxylase family protein [Candidatus Aerophobetes bacterium]|nr:AIR carboxylase family protein [Candidatus Aerophobetes bacterium]
MKVVIMMGSKSDLAWSKKIKDVLSKLGIESTLRIASAHKVPLKVLEIIKEYEGEDVVFVTVAGRSNALSGFVDANVVKPVIACPPYSDKFAGADIFSSLRMPSGVCPMVVLDPEQAAIASAKILAIKNKEIEQKIREYQEKKRREIEEADKEVK